MDNVDWVQFQSRCTYSEVYSPQAGVGSLLVKTYNPPLKPRRRRAVDLYVDRAQEAVDAPFECPPSADP